MPQTKHRPWRMIVGKFLRRETNTVLRTVRIKIVGTYNQYVNRYRRGKVLGPIQHSYPSRKARMIALHNDQGSQANLRDQRRAFAAWEKLQASLQSRS